MSTLSSIMKSTDHHPPSSSASLSCWFATLRSSLSPDAFRALFSEPFLHPAKKAKESGSPWPSVFASMKVCFAAALAAALTATAMSQASPTPAELLRELQAQRALLEEQRKELKQMAETQESFAGAMDSAWLVLCGALVMFMHAGFAMLETGCCRAKNASKRPDEESRQCVFVIVG